MIIDITHLRHALHGAGKIAEDMIDDDFFHELDGEVKKLHHTLFSITPPAAKLYFFTYPESLEDVVRRLIIAAVFRRDQEAWVTVKEYKDLESWSINEQIREFAQVSHLLSVWQQYIAFNVVHEGSGVYLRMRLLNTS